MDGQIYYPVLTPLLIVAGGIAWNAACVICATRLTSDRQIANLSAAVRRAGWIGYAVAGLSGAIYFLWATM